MISTSIRYCGVKNIRVTRRLYDIRKRCFSQASVVLIKSINQKGYITEEIVNDGKLKRLTNKYDEYDRLVEICEEYPERDFTKKEIIEYDSNNLIISRYYYQGYHGEVERAEAEILTYDENDQVIKIEYIKPNRTRRYRIVNIVRPGFESHTYWKGKKKVYRNVKTVLEDKTISIEYYPNPRTKKLKVRTLAIDYFDYEDRIIKSETNRKETSYYRYGSNGMQTGIYTIKGKQRIVDTIEYEMH